MRSTEIHGVLCCLAIAAVAGLIIGDRARLKEVRDAKYFEATFRELDAGRGSPKPGWDLLTWDSLLRIKPWDSRCHLGLARLLLKIGILDEAKVECEQAISFSQGRNNEAELLLSTIKNKLREPKEKQLHDDSVERSIAQRWAPELNQKQLVTRTWTLFTCKGKFESTVIIATSGSRNHDETSVKAINDVLRKQNLWPTCYIYETATVSKGPEKRVFVHVFGEMNEVEQPNNGPTLFEIIHLLVGR